MLQVQFSYVRFWLKTNSTLLENYSAGFDSVKNQCDGVDVRTQTESLSTNQTEALKMACEVGWLDAGDTDLGCLYFEKTKMNHASATTFCQDRSAHLIEIFTLDQLEFIRMDSNAASGY